MDFLNKFKAIWKPNEILLDDISGSTSQPLDEAPIDEDTIIAQKLCDHLNMITDFKKRIESIDYLSEQAKKNFTDISYSTTDEYLVNAITSVGGIDGTVDFALIQHVIDLMLEWYNMTAADSLTAAYRGEF
jgi:hypothetical protein